jgi:putative glutamine amidotransferase
MDSREPTGEATAPPRVGIPWRTAEEERAGNREKLDYYFRAVREAGGEPVAISLLEPPQELRKRIEELNGFVLPGSPADVDPALYGQAKHNKTKHLDAQRDGTDRAILDHAFAAGKPVLAICYGCQRLNVYLGGSLIQDIPAEKPGALRHGNTDLPPGVVKGDAQHQVRFVANSRLAALNGGPEGRINSSHHQAIDLPGKGLRVTSMAPDGIVEGVEWTGDKNWVLGVQWHPERMANDALAQRLFGDFVAATRNAHSPVVHKR